MVVFVWLFVVIAVQLLLSGIATADPRPMPMDLPVSSTFGQVGHELLDQAASRRDPASLNIVESWPFPRDAAPQLASLSAHRSAAPTALEHAHVHASAVEGSSENAPWSSFQPAQPRSSVSGAGPSAASAHGHVPISTQPRQDSNPVVWLYHTLMADPLAQATLGDLVPMHTQNLENFYAHPRCFRSNTADRILLAADNAVFNTVQLAGPEEKDLVYLKYLGDLRFFGERYSSPAFLPHWATYADGTYYTTPLAQIDRQVGLSKVVPKRFYGPVNRYRVNKYEIVFRRIASLDAMEIVPPSYQKQVLAHQAFVFHVTAFPEAKRGPQRNVQALEIGYLVSPFSHKKSQIPPVYPNVEHFDVFPHASSE
ncbi:uncharacterized protein PSFLO_05931 [Pseudozyma flocculosa]|nr:uncharacterized protein PSFLO_05931 [Pseudozyma flocculosa]